MQYSWVTDHVGRGCGVAATFVVVKEGLCCWFGGQNGAREKGAVVWICLIMKVRADGIWPCVWWALVCICFWCVLIVSWWSEIVVDERAGPNEVCCALVFDLFFFVVILCNIISLMWLNFVSFLCVVKKWQHTGWQGAWCNSSGHSTLGVLCHLLGVFLCTLCGMLPCDLFMRCLVEHLCDVI